MSNPLRLLCIEDNPDDVALLQRELRKGGFEPLATRVETAAELEGALHAGDWDVILSDFSLPQFDGLAALELLNTSGQDIPFIVISGAIGEETAVRLMRTGAKDYIAKDKLERLVPVITRELQDATTRRQQREAEAALQLARRQESATRSKLYTILASVPDGLLVCDEEQRVILANQAAALLLDRSQQQILDQPLSSLFDGQAGTQLLQALLNEPDDGDWRLTLELPASSTTPYRWVQIRSATIHSDVSEQSGRVMVLRDITRERELERMKNEFISTAAHELRTPLTTILGYLDLLLQPGEYGSFPPEQQRDFLYEIQSKGQLLSRLVEELLDLSRMEAGLSMQLHRSPQPFQEVVERCVKNFRHQAPAHTLILRLQPAEPCSILLDRDKICEVLDNLLSNAVKYSPADSSITVSSQLQGEQMLCCITDQGIGIAAEQLEQVFEKFYRIDASNTAVRGLGLGLNITRQIIEAHGGKIWLESTPGQGTVACFTLPLQPTA